MVSLELAEQFNRILKGEVSPKKAVQTLPREHRLTWRQPRDLRRRALSSL